MEGKNGLKIVCDSGAGFRRSKLFSLLTILQKNAIAKTKVQFAAI